MRWLLLSALALSALPALAQDDEVEREVHRTIVVNGDTVMADGGRYPFRMEGDGPERRLVFRRGDGEENTVAFRMPDPEHVRTIMYDALAGSRVSFDGDNPAIWLAEMSASPETHRRMRDLEADVRSQVETIRTTDGAERRDAEAALDRTLDELFDVRAQARRERADGLRTRAAAMENEANQIEEGLADRESRRRRIIEARRAALLGESWVEDW